MKIIPATQNHLQSIATLMVKEYQKLNDDLKCPMYQTDYDLFIRVWSKRIVDQSSEFPLFVAEGEKGEFWGFVALMFHQERAEVLMVALEEGRASSEYQALLEYGLQFLKEQGAKFVSFEVAPSENEYLSFLQKRGAKEVSVKYVL